MNSYLTTKVLIICIILRATSETCIPRKITFQNTSLNLGLQFPLYCEPLQSQVSVEIGEAACARKCFHSLEEDDNCYAFTISLNGECRVCYGINSNNRDNITEIVNLQHIMYAKGKSHLQAFICVPNAPMYAFLLSVNMHIQKHSHHIGNFANSEP